MSCSDKTIKHIVAIYAANWYTLTEAKGLSAWVSWMKHDNVDEWCVNEAMRRIIHERINAERFGLKDILKLAEMQAVYYRVKKEINNRSNNEQMRACECSFCKNTGLAWVVAHTDGFKSGENLIKSIPDRIRRFCYKYAIPCSCQIGQKLKDKRVYSISKEGLDVNPISNERHYRILKEYGMDHYAAWTLEIEYFRIIQQVYGSSKKKSVDDIQEEADNKFKEFIDEHKEQAEAIQQPTAQVPF